MRGRTNPTAIRLMDACEHLICDVRTIEEVTARRKVSGNIDLSEELDKVAYHTKLMLNLSEALDYRPARAVSLYRSALCAVKQMSLSGQATRREITTAGTTVTQAIKEMTIYEDITCAEQMGELKKKLSDALDVMATGESIGPSALL